MVEPKQRWVKGLSEASLDHLYLGFNTNPKNGWVKASNAVCLDQTYLNFKKQHYSLIEPFVLKKFLGKGDGGREAATGLSPRMWAREAAETIVEPGVTRFLQAACWL